MSSEASVGSHGADLGLDGAAAAQELGQSGREAAPRAADKHLRAAAAVVAIATIDRGEAGALVGQDLDLLESGGKGNPPMARAWRRACRASSASVAAIA